MQIPQNQAWAHRAVVMYNFFQAFLSHPLHGKCNVDEKLGVGGASAAIRGLEIGVWYAKGSTQIWLNSIPPGSSFTLVDSWKPFASQIDKEKGWYRRHDELTTDAFLSTYLEVKKIEAERSKDDLSINLVRGD